MLGREAGSAFPMRPSRGTASGSQKVRSIPCAIRTRRGSHRNGVCSNPAIATGRSTASAWPNVRWNPPVGKGFTQGGESTTGSARFRYVLQAYLIGPQGSLLPLMHEEMDVENPATQKEDRELVRFQRLSQRLKQQFPWHSSSWGITESLGLGGSVQYGVYPRVRTKLQPFNHAPRPNPCRYTAKHYPTRTFLKVARCSDFCNAHFQYR